MSDVVFCKNSLEKLFQMASTEADGKNSGLLDKVVEDSGTPTNTMNLLEQIIERLRRIEAKQDFLERKFSLLCARNELTAAKPYCTPENSVEYLVHCLLGSPYRSTLELLQFIGNYNEPLCNCSKGILFLACGFFS